MMNPALATVLEAMGCPPAKTAEMAAQLEKRARQLAETRGGTVEAALAHLLGLMRQGWAAQERGGGQGPGAAEAGSQGRSPSLDASGDAPEAGGA